MPTTALRYLPVSEKEKAQWRRNDKTNTLCLQGKREAQTQGERVMWFGDGKRIWVSRKNFMRSFLPFCLLGISGLDFILEIIQNYTCATMLVCLLKLRRKKGRKKSRSLKDPFAGSRKYALTFLLLSKKLRSLKFV